MQRVQERISVDAMLAAGIVAGAPRITSSTGSSNPMGIHVSILN
jgi:hypothetical protein